MLSNIKLKITDIILRLRAQGDCAITALMASSLVCVSWSFFICFLSVVSLVWHIFIARDKVSFQSCKNFFWVVFSLIAMTNRSRMRESCKQAQKLHVCAIVRRAVTCCLTVSFSFFCRLLSMNCSHISFVSPKHSSLNLFTTICVTWNFLKKNVFVYTFWGARWWDGGGVGSAWSLLLSTSFQPLWLSYFLCILVLSTSHMIMMYHYHTVVWDCVASHCIVSLCIVSHCIVWDCML